MRDMRNAGGLGRFRRQDPRDSKVSPSARYYIEQIRHRRWGSYDDFSVEMEVIERLRSGDELCLATADRASSIFSYIEQRLINPDYTGDSRDDWLLAEFILKLIENRYPQYTNRLNALDDDDEVPF
jgi:predicted DNA-binding protein